MTKQHKIAQIKAEAAERINTICPAWKQSNFNARANELNSIRFDREWTAEESAEWTSMMEVWQAVKQIRNGSSVAEQAVNAFETVEEVENFSW